MNDNEDEHNENEEPMTAKQFENENLNPVERIDMILEDLENIQGVTSSAKKKVPRLPLNQIQQISNDSYELPGQIKSPSAKSGALSKTEGTNNKLISIRESGERKTFNWKEDQWNSDLLQQEENDGPELIYGDMVNGIFTPEPLGADNFQKQVSDRRLLWNNYDDENDEVRRREYIVKNAYLYDAEDDYKMPRSKTTELYKINNNDKVKNSDLLYELYDIEGDVRKSADVKRKVPYLETDYISEGRQLATTLQTDQNLVDNNVKSILNTDRPTPLKSQTSSLFGSMQLNTLRSARQLLPKSLNLRNLNNQQHQSSSARHNQAPKPKFNCRRLVKRAISNYLRSCIDGIFLRHLFCKVVSLRWYLFTMTSIDLFLALVDSISLYNRIASLFKAQEPLQKVAMLFAIVFFSLKLLLYIPTVYFEIHLIRKNTITSGKVLYGLKLTMFFMFLLFNLIGLFFLTEQNCNVFHTTVSQKGTLGSFPQLAQQEPGQSSMPTQEVNDTSENDQSRHYQSNVQSSLQSCSLPAQLTEIIGLFFYQFFSCWVILSVLHWIRRGRTDPSNSFFNLTSQRIRQPNPIVESQLRQRPLVHSHQLQQQRTIQAAARPDTAGTVATLNTQRSNTKGDDPASDCEDDLVRLTSKQKNIHVNLKVVMKTLQDFKVDSQRSRTKNVVAKPKIPTGKISSRGRLVAKK